MATVAILDCRIRKILLAIGVERVETHQHAQCHQNRSVGCRNIKIFLFFKMAAVRHLGFFWGIFRPSTVSTWGYLSLCKSAKFGCDRYSSFYNMNISIFDAFGWEMPIHAPKIVVLGDLIPYMDCNMNQSQ